MNNNRQNLSKSAIQTSKQFREYIQTIQSNMLEFDTNLALNEMYFIH